MEILKATTQDHFILSDITFQSKSHWGYAKEQLEKWKPQLTITPDYININEVYKLISEETILGYYSYFNLDEKTVKLDNLFLLPEYIGKGIGRFLMSHFLQQIKKEKIQRIVLDADPNAESFYAKFGFTTIDKLETSIKNRYLPVMELNLA